MDEQTEKKIYILSMHLGVKEEEIENLYGSTFEVGNAEYMVLDEDEADEVWEEQLDNYLDECVLPELPESLQGYFDRDAWKRDARHDGRGHCLASYDGEEHEYQDGDTGSWFYVYRMN